MRFFVAAIVLSQFAQVGYTQQSVKMPKDFKTITYDNAVKPPPTNPNAPSSSPSLATQTQAKAFRAEREKQVVRNNKDMILGGVIGLVVAGAVLIGLSISIKHEKREPGWREVLLCLVALGMLITLGIFQAIFTAAAIGAGSAMAVSFLINRVRSAVLERLD